MSLTPEALEKQYEQNSLPPEAAEIAGVRIAALRSAEPQSFDHIDTKYYLSELLGFPWEDPPASDFDADAARELFDLGVYGPRTIPEETAEYFAGVYGKGAAVPVAEWPVPVLIGPDGVGKRTLARRFGEATGRPVEIINLQLTENDSDLFGVTSDRVRGRPGSIVRALNRARRRDAIVVLAGLDWAVRTWQDHGLYLIKFLFDPSERRHFRDRFLDVEMDLSQTLFVLTALRLDSLPPEVAPRLFPVEWAGYTKPRKLELASSALIPKLLARYSLKPEDFQIIDEGVESIIDEYTNEAGIAYLELILEALCRKAATLASAGRSITSPVDPEGIRTLLGRPRRYRAETKVLVRPGMAKGIALSPDGASIEVAEVALVPGSEGFGVAGNANDSVVKMIDIAYHYIRSRMTEMDISARQLYEYAYRVNMVGLANDVSSQSLGLAVVVAFLSQIRDRLVDPELALIGETTLNGRVIGDSGLQHMLLAAHRNGIRRLLIPRETQEDLEELPPTLSTDISIVQVDDAEQAIRVALE